MKNVLIQGLGFVGSAMAVATASKLDKKNQPIFNVIGVDLPNIEGKARIDSINSGKFPFKINDEILIHELKQAVKRGNLRATDSKESYFDADTVLVSINCDLKNENGKEKIALTSFTDSIREIAETILEDTLVIIESTVPPGTCQKIVYPLFKKFFNIRKLDFNRLYLAHSYERVMPGDEYLDSIINYWRVYSGINEESAVRCKYFLESIINTDKYPLKRLSNPTASETAKLLENSYRAVNIAFMEEWGRFAENVGIDIYEIVDAIRMRPTHSNIRQPGFGVGGYCLTKDPLFAKISARDIFNIKGHEFTFSSQSIDINSEMPKVTLNKIKEYFDGELNKKNILLMGATYKEDVGDTRSSPSEFFAREILAMKAKLTVCDPLIDYWEEMEMPIENKILDISIFDVVVFAVPHKEFQKIDLSQWNFIKDTLIFDANNILTKKQLIDIKKNKINYMSIGRG